MTNTSSRNALPQRLVQLDFLRGAAIILVLLRHSPPQMTNLGWLDPIFKPIVRFGWAGVDLFFVLSGFLVGGLLFAELAGTGTLKVKRFLIRRGFKLWPGYVVFIAFWFLKVAWHNHSVSAAFRELWPNFVHVQNYVLTPAIHTWSLAVEEHFYLVLPSLLLLLVWWSKGIRGLRFVPWISAALLVLCLGLRSWNLRLPYEFTTHKMQTQLRLDGLFLGVCLSYCYYFHPEFWRRLSSHRVALLCVSVLCISPMFFMAEKAPFVFTVGYTLMAVGFASLLTACVPFPGHVEPVSAFWRTPIVRVVARTGIYSYSIYLWHLDLVGEPVFFWLARVWGLAPPAWQWPAYMAIYLPGSIFAGFIMGLIIEFPMLRVRERLFQATKTPVPSIAESETDPNTYDLDQPAVIMNANIVKDARTRTGPARIVLVIPTYNEAEILPFLLPRLAKAVPEADLLLVDDSSPDGTADIAEALFNTDSRYANYVVMRRSGPRGLGVAYRDGFSWALEAGYERIIQMDADLSHDPDDLPKMLETAEHADLVIGSRYCQGGKLRGWAMRRVLLSHFAGWYVRQILGLPFTDPTAGFRCWTRQGLDRMKVATLNSEGYAFQVEMALRAVHAKLAVVEVPITFSDRTQGKSKMSRTVLVESMVLPWKLRFRRGLKISASASALPASSVQ